MASALLIPFVPSDNAVAHGVAACSPASLRSVQHNVVTLQAMLGSAAKAGTSDVLPFLESFLKHRQRPYDALEDAIDARHDDLQKLDALCLRMLEIVVAARHPDVTASLLLDGAALFAAGNPARLRALMDVALSNVALYSSLLAAVSHAAPMLAVDVVAAVRSASSGAAIIDCITFLCDVLHTLSAIASCAPCIAQALVGQAGDREILSRAGGSLAHIMIAYERSIPQLAALLAACDDDVVTAQRSRVWRLLQVASVSCTLLLHSCLISIAPVDEASTAWALHVATALVGAEIPQVYPSDAAVRGAPALLRDTLAALRSHDVLLAHVSGAPGDALRQALTALAPVASAVALPSNNPKLDHASSVASVKSVLPDAEDVDVERAVALAGGDVAAAIDRLLTAPQAADAVVMPAATASTSRAEVKDATLRLVELQAMEEAAAAAAGDRYRVDEETGMRVQLEDDREYGDEYQDEYEERMRDAQDESAEDARAASGAPVADAAPYVHRGGRGRGRGRGGGVVEGHGPRARGGLTERDATFRREHKAHIGNHNRRRGADKKMARAMI